jgi:hypothetical protein
VDPATGLIYMRNRWFEPDLGRFISADPLGYRDGPNRYGFVGGDPVGKGDPLGLYGRDVHQGITQWLAGLAGFSKRDALALGFFAQMPDEDERRKPVLGSLPLLLDPSSKPDPVKAFVAKSLRRWHFPISLTSIGGVPVWRVVPGSSTALGVAEEGISRSSLSLFGQGLHVAQDSFSHQGEPIWIYRYGLGADDFTMFGHPLDRLGPSAATDDPEEFPETALQAMYETFRLMVEFRTRRDGLRPIQIVALWDRFAASSGEMVSFANSRHAQRVQWLRQRNVFVE